MGPTEQLASFAARHRFEDLPANVVHDARRSLFNWLGVAIGASRHDTIDVAWSVVADVGGEPTASVLGRRERTDVLHAAFLNGTSSHVFDFDDTHLATIIHPSGPVAAPLFALAERDGASGAELINAFVMGVDVACRVGLAVYPEHYDAGWHITSTTGVIGAAAASAVLLGADQETIQRAIGIATSQSSGIRAAFGTMTKSFHVGHAAKSGLFAALLAKQGFTSSPEAIEDRRGFAIVLSTARNYDPIAHGLGERYEVSANSFKPFACGIVIHPSIDACIQLRDHVADCIDDITSVELRVHPLVLELTGKRTPTTGLQGKFSVFHSAAVALIDGDGGEPQYSDARVRDPRVVALRDRVEAHPDPTIAEDEAVAKVTLADGTSHAIHVEHAIGSLDRPMTDEDLERKFRTLVEPVLGARRTQEAVELAWTIDRLDTLTPLIDVVATRP